MRKALRLHDISNLLPSRKHCVASARRVEEVFACDGFDVQAVAAAQQRERAVAHRARILVQVIAKDHALAVRAEVVELASVLKVNPNLAVDVLHREAAAIRERQNIIAVIAALLGGVVRHGRRPLAEKFRRDRVVRVADRAGEVVFLP